MRQSIIERVQSNSLLMQLFVVGAIWIASIVRVAKDSEQRTQNVGLHAMYIGLVTFLTPLVGLPLYFILRPSTYIRETMPWRESIVLSTLPCLSCGMTNLNHHQFCVSCGDHLVKKCIGCNHSYPQHYDFCYHCGQENIIEESDIS